MPRFLIRSACFFAFLFSVMLLWLANGGYVHVAKVFYPLPYRVIIDRCAKEFDLDPLFVATVIREESRFRPESRSRQGAVGLMQLMPATATWGAQRIGLAGYRNERLVEPAINIRVGCWYLRYLWKHFGSGEMVLAAYNGGEGNANQWHNPELHAFPETQEYVRRGKSTYEMYRRLYPGNPAPMPWIKPVTPAMPATASTATTSNAVKGSP